jgi:hypothetical protein
MALSGSSTKFKYPITPSSDPKRAWRFQPLSLKSKSTDYYAR